LLPATITVTACEPDAGSAPLHPPDATHESAPVDDQVRVIDFPSAIEAGFAVSVVLNSCGLTTVSVVVLLADWGPFEQISV
jgi:hypothetical protein